VDIHDIAEQPDNEVLFAELAKLEPALAAALGEAGGSPGVASAESATAPAPAAPEAAPEPAPDGIDVEAVEAGACVVMYCRQWCPDCARARMWLDARNIPYTEVDVDRDAEARDRAASHNEGKLHTPTFEIGEDVCVDFREERLIRLLGL